MNSAHGDEIKFEGEDAHAGYAAPLLDLIAAAFLLALSALVVVASLALPVPGDIQTAPGLLPFLTAGSLGVMALLLAISAVQRRRAGTPMRQFAPGEISEQMRSIPLAAAIAIYIAGLQWLAFQMYFRVAGIHYVLSAFEPLTVIVLSAIIKTYWGGPLNVIVAIAAAWTLILSVVFQKIFQIPLPGGF